MPASLELVRIALQAYGNGDSEIALALADPLIRWDERASRPEGELVWGHDDVAMAMREYLDRWEEYRFDLEDIAEVAPGKIVGICRERGRDASGVPVDRRFGGLWVVEDGRIVSWSTYLTPKEAVRAAKELAGGELQPPKPKAAPKQPPGAVAPTQAPQEPPPAQQAQAPAAAKPELGPGAAPAPTPEPAETQAKTKKPVTDEQRRAAKARAKLRKRASKQTA